VIVGGSADASARRAVRRVPAAVTVSVDVADARPIARSSTGSSNGMRCSSWRRNLPTSLIGLAMGRAPARQVDWPE